MLAVVQRHFARAVDGAGVLPPRLRLQAKAVAAAMTEYELNQHNDARQAATRNLTFQIDLFESMWLSDGRGK
jgi:hypothetical protein